MRALFFNQPHDIDVKDFDLPRLEDNEVLVKVGACGFCGTDFHIFEGKAPAKSSVVLGHEYAGEIADAGKNTAGLMPGDHVAINPNIHCGYC
ncbi:MAG: alcohol dehydrogenase catalytic domain-containing protein, partial [Syntrophothermus sp.]